MGASKNLSRATARTIDKTASGAMLQGGMRRRLENRRMASSQSSYSSSS